MDFLEDIEWYITAKPDTARNKANKFSTLTQEEFDKVVFGKKKFSDLLEEIYNNQKRRESQVSALISELKPMVSDIGDATLIVPLIKEYLEIGVKNDDALIKMTTLVQRALNNTAEDGGLGISDEEKSQLLDEIEKIQKNK